MASLALGLVACSGGGGRAEPAPSSTTTAAPVTTAPPATIDLSHPIPGGSLHGTSRPPLENTGDEYVAITESLIANVRWLAENPDPSIVSELYVPGTTAYDYWFPALQQLLANGWRFADENYFVSSIRVVDIAPPYVSLRVVDAMDFERIVDTSGAQVGTGREREPRTKVWNLLIASGADGYWRLADWQRIDEEVVP